MRLFLDIFFTEFGKEFWEFQITMVRLAYFGCTRVSKNVKVISAFKIWFGLKKILNSRQKNQTTGKDSCI